MHYDLKPWWRTRSYELVSSVGGRAEREQRLAAKWLTLLASPPGAAPCVVALYAPMGFEVDLLTPTLTQAPELTVLLPRVPTRRKTGSIARLTWHAVHQVTTWETPWPNRYGLSRGPRGPYRQPIASSPEWLGPPPCWCVIPCLMVDDTGLRLGYGGRLVR
jgi:5-formyltetrahydrofolate cyclo-ligase